jgi:photosystem II stability/assembly factor-like uncharacterized protein
MHQRRVRTLVAAVMAWQFAGAQPRVDTLATLRGNGDDVAGAMTVDRAGNIYVVGHTTSSDIATAGAVQSRPASSNLYRLPAAGAQFRQLHPRARRPALRLEPVFPPSPAGILALAADPNRPRTLYAATRLGLAKTTDNGESWTTLSNGLSKDGYVVGVAVAPSDGHVLYAAIAPNDSYSGSSAVYRSADAGARWQPSAPLPYGPCDEFCFFSVEGLAVDPADPSRVFVSGARAFHSSDGGSSWQRLPLPLRHLVFDHRRPGVLYGDTDGVPSVVVRSTDGGESWLPLNTPPFEFPAPVFPDPARPGTVYLSGHGASAAGIFKSTDGGDRWSLAARDVRASQFLASPGTGVVYAIDADVLVRSDDGFATYSTLGPLRLSRPPAAAMTPDGTLFLGGDPAPDVFVTKWNPAGDAVFTTYLGGSLGETASAVVVDANGDIYVAGTTDSPDFPFTAPLALGSPLGRAGFLLKLSQDGRRLLFSTRVTGAIPHSLALDRSGNIYVSGEGAHGLLLTPHAVGRQFPQIVPFTPAIGFQTKLAPDGMTLLYSTYLGSLGDIAKTVVIDLAGNIYAIGTRVWKLDPAASRLMLDTSIPQGNIMAAVLDEGGGLYLCGATAPGGTFPTTPGAFQRNPPPYSGLGGGRYDPYPRWALDGFVARIDSRGQLLYSTLLGGTSTDLPRAMVVDAQGNATVLGTTQSPDFPTRSPLPGPFHKVTGFLAKLNRDASDIIWSTYLGDERPFIPVGLASHPSGGLVFAGYTYGDYSVSQIAGGADVIVGLVR